MICLDKRTNETFEIDRKRSRVRRCQKRIHAWSEMVSQALSCKDVGIRQVMITLTYRPGEEWEALHISEFMKILEKNLGSGLLAYAWVAEMQQRQAVHYHVLLMVKKGTRIEKPDDAGWWDHGMSNIATARHPFYIVTYTGKEYQKLANFPKGLRLFAIYIRKELLVVTGIFDRFFYKISSLPGWLRELLVVRAAQASPVSDFILRERIRRKDGGGWIVGEEEEFYSSPFMILPW